VHEPEDPVEIAAAIGPEPANLVAAIASCQQCHRLDPNGNAAFGVERPGFFGTRPARTRAGSGFGIAVCEISRRCRVSITEIALSNRVKA